MDEPVRILGTDSGVSSTVLTTLKTAVFAPIPSASVAIATAVNPGCLRKVRSP